MLIGGLGMGFTLRAALAELAPDATVVVAELVPSVVAWARGPMAELFAGSLDDPRVEVREADVADLIASGKGVYDAILLDVDNGPDGLSRSANDRLYDIGGLAAARAALDARRRARRLVGASRQGLHRAAQAIRLRGGGGQHARPRQARRPACDLAGDANGSAIAMALRRSDWPSDRAGWLVLGRTGQRSC